jgi:putative membrane-bound dehydrogenase-like protein
MKKLLYVAVVLSLPSSALAQVPPEKALSTFKVSDGLEITLWAAEPMFVNPTCIDIDHKGRVWVCESVNYRNKLRNQPLRRAEGDRILILEDTKGAGKADKVTVFYQAPDIIAPLGIAVAPDPDGPGCKVYVCHSPDILLFEDKDGDGKADGPPKKLLSGFKGYDHDHGVHGIIIGPDNRLYFSVGDQGVSGLVDKHGKKWTSNSTDCRAGTNWRCDLDGKNLELIAHNFRNQYEPCVDSFGNMFVSDNDDDGNFQTRICFVMPGGNYGYHPRGKGQTHWHEEQPGVVPKILRTYFGSPTGMCVYEGTLLPKKYWGQLLHTDAGPRHLRCYHLKEKGAGYDVEQENMVESSDNWFRPSDVCVAPDGSVFMSDWYDPGVGGHGMGDIKQGRIYRVAPKGNKASVPAVNVKNNKGMLDALGSPNLAVRALAMAKIHSLDPREQINLLEPAAKPSTNPYLRARVLWQLAQVQVNRGLVEESLFKDAEPRYRQLALRIFKDWYGVPPNVFGDALLNDPSPAVRREALVILREFHANRAKQTILDLARKYDGKDRIYLAAVGIAVGADKSRRDAILADFDKEFPEWNESVAGLLWELRPPQMVPLLTTRLTDKKLPPAQRAQIADILSGAADLSAGSALINALPAEASAEVRDRIVMILQEQLAGPWAQLRASAELSGTIDYLLKKNETRIAALSLIGAADRQELFTPVQEIALDGKETIAARLAAVQTLGNFKTKQATESLLTVATMKGLPVELAAEAVLSVGRQNTQQAQSSLKFLVMDEQRFVLPLRQAAVAGLSGSKAGASWLLEAHGKKQLAGDLTPDLARLLRNSPFAELKKQAQKLFPQPKGKLDPKNLPSIPALLARKGNIERGRELMAATLKNEAQCLRCHTINSVGGNVGPDLSAIGSKASRENLLESILYPNRAIPDQYLGWLIETKGGLSIHGLIVEESPTHLVVRDATAKDHKIDMKRDLETRKKSPISVMPDNLILALTEEELVDLVDYMHTLKGPSLTPTSRRREWLHDLFSLACVSRTQDTFRARNASSEWAILGGA